LRWRLSLPGGEAQSALLVYRPTIAHAGRRVAALCSPCTDGASGSLTLTRNEAALLVDGRLALRIDTGGRTVTGVVPRTTQHGLFIVKRP
jgi:hypothetical protein